MSKNLFSVGDIVEATGQNAQNPGPPEGSVGTVVWVSDADMSVVWHNWEPKWPYIEQPEQSHNITIPNRFKLHHRKPNDWADSLELE